MALTIVMPGLIWPEINDVSQLKRDLNIPNLNSCISKSTHQYLNLNYSDIIYSDESPYHSIAQSIAKELGVFDEYSNFLIVEPTHLRLDHTRLLVSEPSSLKITALEVVELINVLNTHFTPDFKFYNYKSEMWLLGLNIDTTQEKFYPTLDIIGEDINYYLASGPNRAQLNNMYNEVQMLLFRHNINKVRLEQNSLSINSLWFWDKPTSNFITKYSAIYTNNFGLLSKHAKIHPLPSKLEDITQIPHQDTLIIIDGLHSMAGYRDGYEWYNLVNFWEENLFSLFKKNGLSKFTLLIPGRDKTLKLKVGSRFLPNLFKNRDLAFLTKEWHAT